MRHLLGHGAKGFLLGWLLLAIVILAFGNTNAGRYGEYLFVSFFVGGFFGAGAGLALGAARARPGTTTVPDGPLLLSRRRAEAELGISRLDLCVAAVYALTATGVTTAALVMAMGRHDLLLFAMDLTPFASLGPGSAKIGFMGTLAVVFGVVLLAIFSRSEPRRLVDRRDRAGLAFSGFASAFAWLTVFFGFVAY